jgi:dephospho-CoA kinase
VLKICVTGGPRTGKTTYATKLAASLGLAVHHTDVWATLPWAEQATPVAALIRGLESGIVEGVTVARGLRYLIREDPARKWCDELHVLTVRHVRATPEEQAAWTTMTKGLRTILEPLGPVLLRSGTIIRYF